MSETWIINEVPDTAVGGLGGPVNINFTSNDIRFASIQTSQGRITPLESFIRFDETIVFSAEVWQNQAYRTVTFDEPLDSSTPIGQWFGTHAEKQITGYSITYHANGGTPIPEDLTNQTELPNPLPVVSKEGFSFEGWYLDAEFTTQAIAGTSIEEDTNLYAKWKVVYATLTDLFTAIANSIRTKKSTSDEIVAMDFPSEIDSIQTGGEQPQLNSVTISLSGSIVTIVPNTDNGNFCSGYDIYVDGEKDSFTSSTTIDLDNILDTSGRYVITVKAVGENFVDSAFSNSVSYDLWEYPTVEGSWVYVNQAFDISEDEGILTIL